MLVWDWFGLYSKTRINFEGLHSLACLNSKYCMPHMYVQRLAMWSPVVQPSMGCRSWLIRICHGHVTLHGHVCLNDVLPVAKVIRQMLNARTMYPFSLFLPHLQWHHQTLCVVISTSAHNLHIVVTVVLTCMFASISVCSKCQCKISWFSAELFDYLSLLQSCNIVACATLWDFSMPPVLCTCLHLRLCMPSITNMAICLTLQPQWPELSSYDISLQACSCQGRL